MAYRSRLHFSTTKALRILDDMSSSDLSEISGSDDEELASEFAPELESCQSKDMSDSEESVGPEVEPEEMPTRPFTIVEEDEGPLPLLEQPQSAEEKLPKKKQRSRTLDERKGKEGPAAREPQQNRKRATYKRVLTGRGGGLRRASKIAKKGESQHSKWANDKKWEKKFNPRQIPQFIGKSGPQMRRASLPKQLTAKVFSELFFTDDVWQLLVDMTNATAKNAVNWVRTSVIEMKAFFGLLLAMPLVKFPKIKDDGRKSYWLLHLSSFAEVMPRDRFLKLYRYLHVSDDSKQVPRGEDGHDPLAKIGQFLNLISDTF